MVKVIVSLLCQILFCDRFTGFRKLIDVSIVSVLYLVPLDDEDFDIQIADQQGKPLSGCLEHATVQNAS